MTQRTLFPLLLVGLPVGLAVSIVVALYLYYNPLDIPLPSRPQRQDVRAFLRRSPNESDLRDYRRILTADLAAGVSASTSPPSAASITSTTADWIASTLGPSNLGLDVRRLEVGEGSADAPTTPPATAPLVIEIPGTRHKNETIVVVTGFEIGTVERDDAVATSIVMTLAGAFTGAPQRRTLLLAFLPTENVDVRDRSLLDAVIQDAKLSSRTVRGIIDVRVGRAGTPSPSGAVPGPAVLAVAPRDQQPWTAEVREAFAPRKPAGLSLEFVPAADAPAAAFALAGWKSPPAPYLLLWLQPAAPNDEASPLALAQSMEGLLQTLANQ